MSSRQAPVLAKLYGWAILRPCKLRFTAVPLWSSNGIGEQSINTPLSHSSHFSSLNRDGNEDEDGTKAVLCITLINLVQQECA